MIPFLFKSLRSSVDLTLMMLTHKKTVAKNHFDVLFCDLTSSRLRLGREERQIERTLEQKTEVLKRKMKGIQNLSE